MLFPIGVMLLDSSKKFLSIKEPFITSYPFHANLVAIIQNDKESLPWIINHYIQLGASKTDSWRLDFCIPLPTAHLKICPWLSYYNNSREFINKKWKNFSDFLIDAINLNYYVYLLVDQFFISAYDFYLKGHIPHDIFISGYDLETREFIVSDFFDSGKYSQKNISFSEIEKAYASFNEHDFFDWINGVTMLSLNKEVTYEFDVGLAINLINDYLLAEDSSERFKMNDIGGSPIGDSWVYGMKIYEVLCDHLKLLLDNKKATLDLREFHVLWDHKKIISSLIVYFEQEKLVEKDSFFYTQYKDIENNTLILRNLLIKYKLTEDANIISRAIDRITDIADKEYKVLSDLLKSIRSKQ